MPDFNPGKALVRVAHSANGLLPLPASAGWRDFEFISSELGNESELVENPSLRGNSQAAEALPGIMSTAGAVEALVNAEGTALFYANAQGAVDVAESPTNVFTHRLAPSGGTPCATELAMLISRDDGLPQNFVGGKVATLSFKWEKGGLLTCSHELIFERSDYWGSAVVVADPSATAPPQVRGIQNFPHLTTAGDDIFVKVISVVGAVATLKAKITAAATYGATTFTATIGLNADGEPIWAEIKDSNTGANYGNKAVHPEVHFPSATALVADDEWRFNRVRTLWTPGIPAVLPFNGIYASVLVDGAKTCIDSFELKLERPIKAQTCLGAAFAHSIRERGVRKVTLSIDKEYLSILGRARLETRQPFKFQCYGFNGVAFEPGVEHEIRLTCPRLIPTGKTPDVDAPDKMSEKIEAQGYEDPTNVDGYVDDLTIELVNSMANISTVV